ncbi:RNA polymerase sigma factor [Paenibacillus sacheonensis]|uniref:Sigma-70 family RNA polymerase sigma factor n=1 Tax=Paenibacillus sacheonensis TaxID=742054 RepID=A0A7X5C115_9BACL|nr:RNA polymerase sigma factor [Paenibacillus sacheonensis]MBM7564396.1 RNA polymerase sigma-70 factor (ECF subfamily) [Paenibacillus sacheonensis]NBC68959.1 sigma-70 family RNA polymerase sigma factor [Paenibacillus sacheonensis]
MTNPKPAAVEEMRFVLYRYCLSLTRSTWDAEDLVQETCLRALPVMNGALAHPNPTAYLMRTAKNIAVDQSRRKQRAGRMLEALQANEKVLNRLYEESPEMEEMLQLLIRHLSPLQRTVFLLKELFGFKNAETAAKLSTSEGAVKAALHRARSAVDKLIQRAGFGKPNTDSAGMPAENAALLQAYVNAVRAGDPQALIVLANAEDQRIDTVQAIGQLNRLGQRFAAAGTGSSSISMCFAA